MDKFYTSKNGEVSELMTREEVQTRYLDAGANEQLPLIKEGETEWQTAGYYGFKQKVRVTASQLEAARVEGQQIADRMAEVFPSIEEMDKDIRLYSSAISVWVAKLNKKNAGQVTVSIIFAHPDQQAQGKKFEAVATSL